MFSVNKVQGASGQETTMDADADLSGAPETFLQNKIKRFEKWDKVKFCRYWFFGTKPFTSSLCRISITSVEWCFRWNRKNRRTVRYICKSQFMFWLIITLVFLNTIIQVILELAQLTKKILCFRQLFPSQATEHHHQPEWLDEFQEYTNLIFLSLFTLEMLMKMYAMSFSVRDWVRLITYCWY